MSAAELLDALFEDSEKSWSTHNRGKPINPCQISRRLSECGIGSKSIRIDYDNKKGFDKSQFDDALVCYLANPAQNVEISVTPPQASIHAGLAVTEKTSLIAPSHKTSCRKQALTRLVTL